MYKAGSVPGLPTRLFAWSGAAMFAAALAFFLYSYAVSFAETGPVAQPALAAAWNMGLFSVFAVHHSVFAREPVRAWTAHHVSDGLERPLYVWAASLLLMLVCALWQPLPGVVWTADGAVEWLLRATQAAGGALALWSATIVSVSALAGLPANPNGTPVKEPRVMPSGSVERASGERELTTRGPYGVVRHPIYLGWFLLVFAVTPMTTTRLMFAVLSCVYVLAAIPLEERTLRATTDGAYERYMARVRWRLVPGIY